MLWTADPAERDAKLAHKALKKKDDRHVWVIIEVACASCSDHLMAVRKAYHSLFLSSIEEDVAFKFSETNPLRQVVEMHNFNIYVLAYFNIASWWSI